MKNPKDVRIPLVEDPLMYVKGYKKRMYSFPSSSRIYESLCRFSYLNFHKVLPKGDEETISELEENLKFTNLDIRAEEVVACSYFVLFASLAMVIPLILFLYYVTSNILVVSLFVIPFLLSYLIMEYPKTLANNERMKALGYAPEIISYLVIPLKRSPNLEEAVKFASEHSKGKIAEDLRNLQWKVISGKYRNIGDGLIELGLKWGKYVEGFKNAIYLIRASQLEKSEGSRRAMLDKAVDTILSSILRKFITFSDSLVKPIMILFNFGILLPLIVISILPVMTFVGEEIITLQSLSGFMILIILLIFAYTSYILKKRPPSFPPIDIPDDHPGLDPGKISFLGTKLPLNIFTLVVVGFTALPGILYLLKYKSPLVEALGTYPLLLAIALGIFIYFRYSVIEKKKIRDEIAEMEKEAMDAFYQIGNRLEMNVSPEEALKHVSETMKKSKISKIFKDALKNINERNMTLEQAFFDEHYGSLRNVYSDRIRNLTEIFVRNVEKGSKVAAEALLTAVNYMLDIQKVEDEVKRKTSNIVSTMKLT
ncbi:MAG TPA: hypothetical protein ENG50_03575, partial [Candidatus Altiarchaeales archaeon]|nr:hypothetical protein [Candidatus Altiarchaeales archaeon]